LDYYKLNSSEVATVSITILTIQFRFEIAR